MATYTMELRKVIDYYGRDEVESWFSSYELSDFLTPEQISQISKYNVWTKEKLAKQIVDHYYMREIGFETPALFKHYAKVTMQEIMGRYLLGIYSAFLKYDPLSSVDYIEQYKREITGEQESQGKSKNEGSSNSTSENETNSMQINNNTPQRRIQKQELESGIFATTTQQNDSNANIKDKTETNSSSDIENKGKSKTIETFTHSMKGDNGVIVTNQYLVREFRELIINYNEEIIKELNSLFMGLY